MSVQLSLLIPTRHRPQFVAQALAFVGAQDYDNYHVVVSDNFENPAKSCDREFEQAGLTRATYVRPEKHLGMVSSWNFLLDHAKGDYVLFFTDKMLLLPGILTKLAQVVEETNADLVSWVDDSFIPDRNTDYFGAGYYRRAVPGVAKGARYEEFDPRQELSRKGRAEVSRPEQSRSAYARGKICFGAYSTDLIKRIVNKYGSLFFPISPDYTSMILGLTEARKAVEIGASGIVHIQTDISNGAMSAISDDVVRQYLQQAGDMDTFCNDMLVRGLYTAQHNAVTHDYLSLRRQFGLSFDFNEVNWLTYICEDLDIRGRIWSSPLAERQQRQILLAHLEHMDKAARMKIKRRLVERNLSREASVNQLKSWAKSLLPAAVYDRLGRASGRRGHYATDIRTAIREVYAARGPEIGR